VIKSIHNTVAWIEFFNFKLVEGNLGIFGYEGGR
jgi:hypothetical protein